MGLDTAAVQFLCAARNRGVDFSRMAMIGRQWFFPDADALERVLSVLQISADPASLLAEPYAEGFFELLGARSVDSLDASPYENATIIHDLNHPIPAELRERFRVVYDGGTLEHIFHFPQALKNCMEMVEVGGHFLQMVIANNFMGHGFWQVSPELAFRALSPDNGYRIVAVLLTEVEAGGGAWFAVRDPDEIRNRVELRNHRPTYMAVIAQRTAVTEIFARPPQQSDYAAAWSNLAEGEKAAPWRPKIAPRLGGLRRWIPRPLKVAISSARQAVLALHPAFRFKSAGYRRILEAPFLRGEWT
jgi:hypothetical protein